MTHLDDAALDELARLAGEAANTEHIATATFGDVTIPVKYSGPETHAFIAAANPATVAALVAEVRQLRQCLAGARHALQMDLAGLQDEPAFAVPLVVRGLGQAIDAIAAALDGGQ